MNEIICPQCNSDKLKKVEREYTEYHCLECGNIFYRYEERKRDGGFYTENTELKDVLIKLINENQILNAIKLYKETKNCGLKEAKDYIENLRKQNL